MKDAQQEVIEELRMELERAKEAGAVLQRHMNLCREIAGCPDDETLAVWLEKELSACVRLDDPVVKVLVEALDGYANGPGPECFDYAAAEKALAAYNAKCKEGK